MLLKSIYNKLVTLGIHDDLCGEDKQIIKTANIVYVIAFFAPLSMSPLNYIYGHKVLVLFNVINSSIYALALFYFAQRREYERGYTFTIHGSVVALFLYNAYLGVNSYVDLYLFSVLALVIFVYAKKDKAKLMYYFTVVMMTYAAMHLTQNAPFFEGITLQEDYLEFNRMSAYLVNLSICSFSLIGYTKEQKRREESMRKAKVEIEHLLDKKTTFFSMLNHEIRTPLQGIIGLSELLSEKKSLNDDLKEKLKVINFSALNLKNIVGDILDYSKSEEERLTFNLEPFNLIEVLDRVDSVQSLRIESKGLFFEKKIDKLLPKSILSDAYRINQVINNLLENAVKFTQRGSVTFTVSFESLCFEQGVLHVKVSDTGIGIPEEDQAKVFDAYAQIAPVKTRNFDGTGLGLAICKNIIEQLGGEISLSSDIGKGTAVSFSLPVNVIADVEQTTTDTREIQRQLRKLSGLKVLLVEDNLINQYVCQEVFKNIGVQYFVESDGYSAVEFLKHKVVDFIIMDYHMPGMDGYVTAREIRKNEQATDQLETPIILATADVQGTNEEAYSAYGINGHIVKPFTKNDLIAKLASFQEKFKISTDIMNNQTFLHQIDFTGAQVSIDFIQDLLGQDREAALNLLEMVLKSVPESIERIRCFEHVDLHIDGNQQHLITAVHNLKSNLRNIGAKNFALALQIAEENIRKDVFDETLWEAIAVVENNLEALTPEDLKVRHFLDDKKQTF